jgi:hypothetical protein
MNWGGLGLAALALWGASARADDRSGTASGASNTPYIDSLQQELKKKDSNNPQPTPDNPQPYIDSIKRKMNAQDAQGAQGSKDGTNTPIPSADNPQPFIDQLKSQNPSLRDSSDQSYIDQQKNKLGPDNTTGAIDAVNNGTSALQMKRPGEIKNLFSLEVGTLYNHQATTKAGYSIPGFAAVYGSGYAPDVRFEYERYLIGGDSSFTLGVMAFTAIQYFVGYGIYLVNIPYPSTYPPTSLPGPNGATYFPSKSQTRFAFVNIPLGVGPVVHFNFLKYVRPYAEFMPVGSAFFESRNDDLPGHHGLGLGMMETGGVAIMLDWISKDATWALYRDYGIKHVYLTAEISRYDTPFTPVDLQFTGLDLGFSFEY